MSINLQALEQALAAVEEVGKGELSFEINNTTMTLRVLMPEEEVEVQKYAAVALNSGEEGEQHTAMAFLDRFKTAIISYALVEIDDLDLRDAEFIETGEKLPNGKIVKIPKAEALQKIIRGWTRHLLIGVFRKYAELLAKVEKVAEDSIEFEPVDIDTEIQRLEERLAELRESKEAEASGIQDPFTNRVHRMAEMNGVERPDPSQTTAETADPDEEEPLDDSDEDGFIPFVPEAHPSKARQRIVPTQAPPPQEAPAPHPKKETSGSPVDLLPEFQESFVDTGDTDGLAAAVAAENARQLKRRAQAGLSLHNALNPDGSALTAAHQQGLGRRTPPHLAAQYADRDVRPQEQLTEAIREAQHRKVGTIGDAPVFKPEDPVVLESVSTDGQGPGRVAVNPSTSGSLNPRFRRGTPRR